MKIIVGLLLVATALAYPVAENEEKSNLPLVITDYSSVAELKQQPAQDSAESGSASSESEESSEKPLEAKPIIEEKNPAAIQLSSEETSKSDEKLEAEKPKIELKVEEPAAVEPLKEEKKEMLEAKPSELLPGLKAPEPAAPSVKSIPAEPQAEPAVTTQEAVAQITNKPDVLADKPEEVAPASAASIEEKPLALPSEEKIEESPKPAATEIKEEIALPSEQKVEASPAAEEKLPEIKPTETSPEIKSVIEHIDDKKDLTAPPAAEIKSDSEKRSKSEEIPKVEATLEEKKPEEQQPQEQKPAEVKLAEEKAPEKKAEGKSEDLPIKPLEEIKPTEAIKEEKTEEPKQEPLPTASASSSS